MKLNGNTVSQVFDDSFERNLPYFGHLSPAFGVFVYYKLYIDISLTRTSVHF